MKVGANASKHCAIKSVVIEEASNYFEAQAVRVHGHRAR